MFRQLVSPNPNILCSPGWCLQYVRQAFGLPARYPMAIAAWDGSSSKHRDYNFPSGVWVPLWFAVRGVPAGHVVLRAPDGSIFSTTDNSTTPRKHPNLNDLLAIYAGAGLNLTFLGWTEDVADTPVVQYVADTVASGKLITVTSPVAIIRTSPRVEAGNIAAAYPSGIARGAKIAAVGYVAGQDPYPNDGSQDDAWIKTISGYYVWANAVGNSLEGLAKLN